MKLRTRLRVLIVGLSAVLVVGCASAPSSPVPATNSSSLSTPAVVAGTSPGATSPTVDAPQTAADWTALLAQSGVAVQASETDPTTSVPTSGQPILRLTNFQLQNMAAEVAVHGGILGTEIDAEIPMPDGAPPFSYLLAAWVSTETSVAADAIRAVMGEQDWTQAPAVVFPTIGIELFLAELGVAARGPAATIAQPIVRTAAFTPCSAVAGFVQDALATIFGALKIDPSQFGNDVPGSLLGFLSRIWNVAVQLAQSVVQNAIRELTRHFIDIIRTGLATLAVISMLASYLKPIAIAVESDPERTAFAIGDAPDNTGAFHARADVSSVNWPPVLVDCARAVDFPLPELASPGSPVHWTVTGSAPGLLRVTSPATTTLATDRTSKATYVTSRETQDQADRGQPVSSGVWATAEVERKEITDIKAAVEGFVLGQLPPAVGAVVNPILGPIVHDLVTRAAGALDAVFKVHGSGFLIVDHHAPPEPTPTPAPTKPPPASSRPTPLATPSPTSPAPSGTPTPPCAPACGTSNGDPHLHTIDGHSYDFQAAGEFTLLRSPDGSVEIQSRQEPLPGSTTASINTAVAVGVNGHRVAVYLVDDALQLRIDGVITTDAASADLGAGGAIAAYQSGFQVSLPDGTVLWLLSLKRYGVNVIVRPSPLLSTGSGLLGPVVPGGLEVPLLPDGTRLPRPADAHARYALIYGQLAAGWRVTAATSLFDYDDGKDTDSYTVAGFPDEPHLVSLSDLSPDQQAQGQAICADLLDPDLRDECVFDVSVTGDPSFAQAYELTGAFLQNGTAALGAPAAGPTPGPTPGPMPAGFFDIAPNLAGLKGAALGPTGTLYVSLDLGSDQFEVLAVDPSTGSVLAHADAQGGGLLKVASGSVWVGEFTGGVDCSITRLDAGTLAVQATIAIPCDIMGSDFTVFDDAIWFIDRVSDGGQTEQIRRIDPQTDQPDAGVALPFFNGFLGSTESAIFYGDTNGWYRLHTGESTFAPFGAAAADLAFGASFGVFPTGDGYWTWHLQSAAFYSTGSVPDRTVPIDGMIVGADDQAVYGESSDPVDGTATLWRYPADGSTPAQIGRAATINGQSEGYSGVALLVGKDAIVTLWPVANSNLAELIEQRVALP